jgi:hypothetical protein
MSASSGLTRRLAFAALAAATLSLPLPSSGAEAIPGAAMPKGHYQALDALPDWGGVWTLEPVRGAPPAAPPALKGSYLARYQALKAQADANHGEFPRVGSSYCTPPGIPYQMGLAQYPIEFLFTPGRVTLLLEAWTQVRRVFTDGRKHPDDLEASFYGHSVGHWEGQTLVIETVGLKPGSLINPGMGHSDKERIVERIALSPTDADLLVNDLTVTDPEALETPWRVTYRYRRHRDWDLLEFACAENDRNPVGDSGTATFKP